MKLAHLVMTACVALALYTVSCTTNQQDNLPAIDSTAVLTGDGTQPDSVGYDADTLAIAIMEAKHRYDIPVKANAPTSFCGQVNDPTDTKVYKITLYFTKNGAASAKKIAFFRISGANTFSFKYHAPENGKVQLLVEEQRGAIWKNLQLEEVPSVPEECCGSQKAMLMMRSTVATSDSSSSGTTVKVEQ